MRTPVYIFTWHNMMGGDCAVYFEIGEEVAMLNYMWTIKDDMYNSWFSFTTLGDDSEQ